MPRLLCLAIVVALPFLPSTTRCEPADNAWIDKPDLQVGDQWTFRRIDLWTKQEPFRFKLEVTRVEEDDLRLTRTRWKSDDIDEDGRQTKLRADRATWTFKDRTIVEGQIVNLLFPLEIGKKWDYKYAHLIDGAIKVYQDCEARVERWEDVVLPAGTFKAIKVSHACTWRNTARWGGRSTSTLWYVPGLRQVVQREWNWATLVPFGNGGTPYDQYRDELIEYTLK